jgi:hypothetical protein
VRRPLPVPALFIAVQTNAAAAIHWIDIDQFPGEIVPFLNRSKLPGIRNIVSRFLSDAK